MKTTEYRSDRRALRSTELRARASIERRDITDTEKTAGYIGAIEGDIPFNSDSQTLTKRGRPRPFVERIHPDAFKRSLSDDKDIMLNAGHTEDPLSSIARIGENLTITSTDKALHYRALVPDTEAGRDLLTLIDKRVIRGTSFEFELRGDAGDKWEKRSDSLDERTIIEARLLALNPVIWPAYEDTSLTVELRRRQSIADEEHRGSYATCTGIVDYYDPTVTADTKFASNALYRATHVLTDALEYLRAAPAGAMADFAKAELSAASANAKTLVDWLAANGAEVNPAAVQRAQEKIAEARSATAASADTNQPDYDRERRRRILQLSSR